MIRDLRYLAEVLRAIPLADVRLDCRRCRRMYATATIRQWAALKLGRRPYCWCGRRLAAVRRLEATR